MLGGVATAALGVAPPVQARKGLVLSELLRLAATSHASYATRVSGTTLEEQYRLLDVTGGAMRSVEPAPPGDGVARSVRHRHASAQESGTQNHQVTGA